MVGVLGYELDAYRGFERLGIKQNQIVVEVLKRRREHDGLYAYGAAARDQAVVILRSLWRPRIPFAAASLSEAGARRGSFRDP